MRRSKSKRLLEVITIILVVLTLLSIVLLIISPKDLVETLVEIISIIVGTAALAVAIIAQVSANREEKRLHGIITKLQDLVNDSKTEAQFDAEVDQKLDKILQDLHDPRAKSVHNQQTKEVKYAKTRNSTSNSKKD